MKLLIVGVMGPGERATADEQQTAYELGHQIALAGWLLLTGGRNQGVMNAASQGAKKAGGLTLGILPQSDRTGVSEAVDIPILTGLGSARNAINALTSDVVIACGMGAGTASEIALAIKANKPVILLSVDLESQHFFERLAPEQVWSVHTVAAAIAQTRQLLQSGWSGKKSPGKDLGDKS